MILVVLTPFAANIKKIKWGDFEAELLTKDIEKLQEQTKELKDEKINGKQPARTLEIERDLHELTIKDPSLALAKLRIEICNLSELLSVPYKSILHFAL